MADQHGDQHHMQHCIRDLVRVYSQELGPIPSQSYLLRAAEALIIQLPVGFNQPTKPNFLRADIRDVTYEICKLRKSYH